MSKRVYTQVRHKVRVRTSIHRLRVRRGIHVRSSFSCMHKGRCEDRYTHMKMRTCVHAKVRARTGVHTNVRVRTYAQM